MKKILAILIVLTLIPTILLAQSEIVSVTQKLECRWQLNSGPELYKNNNGLITKVSFSTILRNSDRTVRRLQKRKRNATSRKQKKRLEKKIRTKKTLADTIRECEDGTLDGLCCLTCLAPTC